MKELYQLLSVLGRRALEVSGLVALFAFLPELLRGQTGGILEPHPAWIAVLILATRGGTDGVLVGLIASASALGIAAAVVGGGPGHVYTGLNSTPNLIAFGVCLMIARIGTLHVREREDLRERLRLASARAVETEAILKSFQDVVATLRARVDRMSTSLSFIRDVASRLEGKDPIAAAQGAADLIIARTGVGAAAIRVSIDGQQRLLAQRDEYGLIGRGPNRKREADLSVPIRNGDEDVGVMALWGIPEPGLDEAAASDLAIIAAWCSRPLTMTAWNSPSVAMKNAVNR